VKNILTRLLLFVVALPILYLTAWYGSFLHRMPISLLAIAFSIGAGVELLKLLEPQAPFARKLGAAILAGAPSLAAYLGLFMLEGSAISVWLSSAGSAIMVLFLLASVPKAYASKKRDIQDTKFLSSHDALLIFYPGFISSALMMITGSEQIGGQLVIWFSLVVFANDSFAWLIGISLGRHRGIFSVSPNKSLEGLIAGLSGSMAASLAGPFLFPALVPANWPILVLLGGVCGFFVVAGDLFESALKRSAEVKDSGDTIPGRGGFLDSFDSIMFTAPAFAFFMAILGIL
jgi:phosphatidate cytidylyltransferase